MTRSICLRYSRQAYTRDERTREPHSGKHKANTEEGLKRLALRCADLTRDSQAES